MRSTCWWIAALLLAAPASAQESAALTEDDFLAVLDGNHPAELELSEDLGAAKGRRRQAGRLHNPTFDFDREQPEDVPSETVWQIAWAPPLDGRRRSAVREGDAAVLTETSNFAVRRGELRRDLRRTYAEWANWHFRGAILEVHVTRLEALAQRMRRRAESGEESILDARRLEIAALSSSAALAAVSAQETSVRASVAAWLAAVRTDIATDLSPLQPILPELPQAPKAVDPALHPDLVAAVSRLEQAEAREKLSRQVFVAPELRLGWQTIDTSTTNLEGPVFGLNWTVPIFDRQQGDRLAAESAVTAARARSDWEAEKARSELTATRVAYTDLRESALAADRSLAGLDDVSRAATAAYEHGETSVTDLLDTLRAVLETRLSALDLYLAALAAHRELEFGAGRSLTSGGLS